jgi:ABC-2 type transport system permease protein
VSVRFAASLAKEVRLILRDPEALLLLFVMPLVFVVIMSLALQEPFRDRAGIQFPVLIVNQDDGPVGEKLAEHFTASRTFRTEVRRELPAALADEMRAGKFRFAIVIPPKMTERASRRVAQGIDAEAPKGGREPPIEVGFLTDPTVRGDQRALVMASLNRALQAAETAILLRQVGEAGKRLVRAREMFPEIPLVRAPARLDTFVEIADAPKTQGAKSAQPTSAQQHVPSWTLLAMFLLVIPLSVTFIRERQQGSLLRLQSLAIPPWLIVGAKVVPFFVINQMQMAIMLAAGVYLLPVLGGEALELGSSPAGLTLISAGASLAAIGYGFLLASFARTTEQATIFGPVSVLILAGIGGVLVPKMIMPPILQQIGMVSPFSWALEGFFDVFLRGGGVPEVLPELGGLLAFGMVCFAIALWRFRRQFGL